MLRIVVCASVTLAATVAFAQNDMPPPKVVLPAPVGGLVAIARTPFPSTDVPENEDFDSTLVVIKDADSRVIARRVFASRFIMKMLWSPDGRFLALCSASAGGHSPGHMNSYFWSRSDRHFRSIDYRAGYVTTDSLSFAPPHTLTLQIAPIREGILDINHPVEKQVDLEQIRRTTPPLRGDANT